MLSLEKEAVEICQRQTGFFPTTIGVQVLREQFELDQSKTVYLHQQQVQTKKYRDNENNLDLFLTFPQVSNIKLPVVLYLHGGQFMRGSFRSYQKIVYEIAARAQVCVVFVEYSLAPEKQAPCQQNEILRAYQSLAHLALEYDLDLQRLIVVGDDVGANFAMQLAVNTQKNLPLYKLVLLNPVLNANFDTSSYYSFAGGYGLTREQMKWAWQQYLGSGASFNDPNYCSLLLAPTQLKKVVETLIITAEADVVRDEGEAMARKLRDCGVKVAQVRIQGIIHDFMIKNELDTTNACRIAMNLVIDWIKKTN